MCLGVKYSERHSMQFFERRCDVIPVNSRNDTVTSFPRGILRDIFFVMAIHRVFFCCFLIISRENGTSEEFFVFSLFKKLRFAIKPGSVSFIMF